MNEKKLYEQELSEGDLQTFVGQVITEIKRLEPFCLLLEGPLGSGKTTFAQFLIRSLIPTVSNVQSPTFNIVNGYEDEKHIVSHLDLYRLKHQDELLEIGFEEFLYSGITIIEWPELAENIIHKNKASNLKSKLTKHVNALS